MKCENHPPNTALLSTPKEFGEKCPNGGCTEICGQKLGCGHQCEEICHHVDHTKMVCRVLVEELCNRGRHVQRFDCHERLEVISRPCEECLAEDEAEKKRAEKDNKGMAKQAEKKAEQERKEMGKGSEQGQAARAENSKKWWQFWKD